LCGCNKKKEIKIPEVTVFKVRNEEYRQVWTLVGETISDPKVDLLARVKGFLVKRDFKQGAFVKKGEPLFQIEKDQYIANVNKAKAQLAIKEALLKNAMIVYKRSVFLKEKDTISQAELDKDTANKDSAIGERDAANASLREAQLELDYTDIKAPFDGRIGLAKYNVGNVIGPDSGILATVVSLDPMKVEFSVNEADFLYAQEQAIIKKTPLMKLLSKLDLRLILSNGTEYPHSGEIYFWDNSVNASTGTILMRAKFDNHDFLLHPGQYVKVRIQSSFPKKGLVIPQVAVQSALGGKFVMVVNKDNIIEIKDIALGYKFLDKVVIKKGLNVGDRVVTQGIQKVRRGMTVTPIFDSPLIEDPGEMETVSKEKAASDLKSSSQTFGDKKTH
jgi:membrane fusion protein (multidrug efflux system)